MLKFKNLVLRLFGRLVLYIFYVVLVAFYLVLFQIPIPFIGDNVAHLLQKKYASQAKFIDNLQIGGVSIAWNYEINRPIILIKNITYTSGNKVTKLAKVGFYPNIPNSIKKKTFLIEKIYVEGLHILINQDMQKHIGVKLSNISSVNSQEKKEATNQLHNLGKRFDVSHIYTDIKSIKHMAPVLAYLNEFSISDSDIVFINRDKQSLTFNVESLNVKDLKNIKVDIKSTLRINTSFSRAAKITGSLILNSKEEVTNHLIISDLYLEDIMSFSTGLLNKEFLHNLSLRGFLAKIEIESIYNLQSGFKDIKGKLHIGSGSIVYKGKLTRNLEIDKMQMNLGYNKSNGDVDFNNLVVNFNKRNHLELNKLGADILLSELSMNAKLNLKTKQLLVYRSFLLGNSQKVNFSAKYNYADASKQLINFSSNMGKMTLQDLKTLWPKKIALDVREWFDENVLKANISSVKFDIVASLTKNSTNIEKVSSEILFNNVELTYVEGLPTVKSDNVKLVSTDSDIVITFGEAVSDKLQTSKGLVKIYDYSFANGYQPGVYVDLDINEANIPDVLTFIDKKPLELLHDIDINIADLSGTAQGNITLLYAIDDDKLVDFNGKVVAKDVGFENVFQKQNLTGGNVDVSIGKDYIIFNGKATYLETPANLDIRYSWGSGKTVAKYALNFDRLDISKLNKLNLIDEKILNQFKGLTDLAINYKEYEKVASVNIQADLKQAEWSLQELNYVKPVGSPLFLKSQISLDNNNLVGIDRLSLSNNDINIVLSLTKNNEDIAMKVSRLFIRNKADAKVNFLWQKDNTNIFVRGRFLDITGFIDDFKAGDDSTKIPKNNKKQSSKLGDVAFNGNNNVPIYAKERDSLLKNNTVLLQANNKVDDTYSIHWVDSESPLNKQTDSSNETSNSNEVANSPAVNDNTNATNNSIEVKTPETATNSGTEDNPNTLSKDTENKNPETATPTNIEPNANSLQDTNIQPNSNSNSNLNSNPNSNSHVKLNVKDSKNPTKSLEANPSNNSKNSDNTSIDKIAVGSKPLHNYKIDLVLQSVRSHNITFTNPNINLVILNNILDYMDFSYFEGTHKSYIFYNSKEKGLLMEVNNVGNLLQFLDVKARLKNGFLQVKATVEKVLDPVTKRDVFVSKGTAILNDFSLYLALGFSSVAIDFNSRGYYFNLKNIELTGNLMGGHLSGYLDYNKKYLDVSGKLIPIWSANHLISNAPIIRQLLGNNKEGNNNSLLQINMAIKGPLDKLDYSIFSKGGKKGDKVKTLNNDEIIKSLDENNTNKAKEGTKPNTNLKSEEQNMGENSATNNEISNSPTEVEPNTNNPQNSVNKELTEEPTDSKNSNTTTNDTESKNVDSTSSSTPNIEADKTQDTKPSTEKQEAPETNSNNNESSKSNTNSSSNKASTTNKESEEGLNLQDLLN